MKKTTSISLRNKFLNSTALLAATIALAFAAQSNTAKAACSITTDNGTIGLSDDDIV